MCIRDRCYSLQNRIAAAEQNLTAADKKNVDLADRLDATNARLRATADTLGQNVGATQKQIDARTAVIIAAQKSQNAETAKLAQQQQASEQQIGAVSSDVASVKTDVGGVKTDVATTVSYTHLDVYKRQIYMRRTPEVYLVPARSDQPGEARPAKVVPECSRIPSQAL